MSSVCMPIYTSPFAIVGSVNFTAIPARLFFFARPQPPLPNDPRHKTPLAAGSAFGPIQLSTSRL